MLRRNSLLHSLYTRIGAFCLLAICFVLLVFSSMSVLAAERVVQPDAPGSISGHVKNLKGDPLEGIRVFLFSSDFYNFVTTDHAGFYRFPILAPNEYVVSFGSHEEVNQYLPEYYADAKTIEDATKISIAGNQVDNIDAMLKEASRITGTISYTGTSISQPAYLNVYAYRFDEQSANWIGVGYVQVDSGTDYVIGGLMAGTYRVCAWTSSKQLSSSLVSCYGDALYVTSAKDVVVGEEATVTGIYIVFRDDPDYATISGRVLDTSGNPISGTAIYVFPSTYFDPSPGNSHIAISDQNGDYTINTLVPNVFSYTVWFSDPSGNHLPEYYNNAEDSRSAKTFRPQARQVISNVNAVLEHAAHISGTITVQQGVPFVEGSVKLFQKVGDGWQNYYPGNSFDRASGNYHFAGLSAGVYRICADFYLTNQQVSGCYGSRTVVSATDISLTTGQVRSDIDFDVSTKAYDGIISGQVHANGAPLTGIRVELIAINRYTGICDVPTTNQVFLRTGELRSVSENSTTNIVSTSTDGQGNYKFEGLTPGYYILKASDPQLHYGTTFYNENASALALTGINLDCGQIRESANISMTGAGAVSGRITIASGKPLSNTEIRLLWPLGYDEVTNQVTVTNQDGNYLVRGVQPGTYWLMALSSVNIYPYEYPISEYYGASSDVAFTPRPITVTSGLTVTDIDIILGPDGVLWLPLMRKEN